MKKKKNILSIIVILILILGFFIQGDNKNIHVNMEDNLEVHFIDVGHADAILIKNGEESMLIDGGDNSSGKLVVDYIKNQGIDSIKYVIGTHPHEDHIGGLDNVIDSFNIEKVIMPNANANTKTFEDVLNSISNKGLTITKPRPGDKYNLNGAEFIILAPNKDKYSNLNNYSVVVKLTHGNSSFVFTGDAETLSEKEILDNFGGILKADLLKLGHHGSNTSTSENFLEAVNPQIAIISLGRDNKYNHPDIEVVDRLREKNIDIYRTDEEGTIVAISDGESITINDETVASKKQDVDLILNILSKLINLFVSNKEVLGEIF